MKMRTAIALLVDDEFANRVCRFGDPVGGISNPTNADLDADRICLS